MLKYCRKLRILCYNEISNLSYILFRSYNYMVKRHFGKEEYYERKNRKIAK